MVTIIVVDYFVQVTSLKDGSAVNGAVVEYHSDATTNTTLGTTGGDGVVTTTNQLNLHDGSCHAIATLGNGTNHLPPCTATTSIMPSSPSTHITGLTLITLVIHEHCHHHDVRNHLK